MYVCLEWMNESEFMVLIASIKASKKIFFEERERPRDRFGFRGTFSLNEEIR